MADTADTPLVAVTGGDIDEREDDSARLCAAAIERAGGKAWRVSPSYGVAPPEMLARAGALVLSDGADFGLQPPDAALDAARDDMELAYARAAMEADLPTLGVGRGMQILNAAAGGQAPQAVEAHTGETRSGARHHIYISPGGKLAAVVGSGGIVRVNSLHRLGVREAQKSPRLLASAYSLEDGVIEALESPPHRWIIAVQFAPERRMEIPPHFDRLFQSLAERAAERRMEIPSPSMGWMGWQG